MLAGVKARRYAPPPLRGADGLDTACAHGHRQSLPDSPGTLFSQEGPEFDVLTEHLGVPFHVATKVPFLVAISTPGQLVKCDRAVRCAYKELADNVTKVRESLGSLKAEVEAAGR